MKNHSLRLSTEELDKRYINRELSWLAFCERVIEESANHMHPVLERVRFLSIACGILDEFFMVRVAMLQDEITHSPHKLSIDGKTPKQELKAIKKRTQTLYALIEQSAEHLHDVMLEYDIRVVGINDLEQEQKQQLNDHNLYCLYNINILAVNQSICH